MTSPAPPATASPSRGGVGLQGRRVVVTGLRGGLGAALAKELLLAGVEKVTLHHPDDQERVTEDTLEACCGLLRASDLGDHLSAAIGRRLRGWVLAEGAEAGGSAGEGGRVEVLTHDPVEDTPAAAAADAVVACDGGGPLSVLAGLGEAARQRQRGPQSFLLAQTRGLVGTVFVDSGDAPRSRTLYQALRPRNDPGKPSPGLAGGEDGDDIAACERTRHEVLHRKFLGSHPETQPLIPPKAEVKQGGGIRTEQANATLDIEGADAEGTAPGAFALLVAAFAVGRLVRLLAGPECPTTVTSSLPEDDRQWFHLDALALYHPSREIVEGSTGEGVIDSSGGSRLPVGWSGDGYKPIPESSYEVIPETKEGPGEEACGDRHNHLSGTKGGGAGESFEDEGVDTDAGGEEAAGATGMVGAPGQWGVQAAVVGADVQRRLAVMRTLVVGAGDARGGVAIVGLAGAGVGSGVGGCLKVADARGKAAWQVSPPVALWRKP